METTGYAWMIRLRNSQDERLKAALEAARQAEMPSRLADQQRRRGKGTPH